MAYIDVCCIFLFAIQRTTNQQNYIKVMESTTLSSQEYVKFQVRRLILESKSTKSGMCKWSIGLGREDTGRRLTKQTKKHNTEDIKDEQHQNSGMNPGAVPVFYKTPP
jgi:hypothetical protein